MTHLTPIGGEGLGAYVALPAAGTGPLLVVLQEIFGVNANIRALCDEYAQEGYVAIAPDLFWRQGRGIDIDPSSEQAMDRALALLASFDDAQAMQDITASIAFAQHLHGCPRSVAAVGYCLGGRLALRSLFDTAVTASVSYYGVGLETLATRPLPAGKSALLHVPQQDIYCSAPVQATIREAARGPLKAHFYPGCDHAFARAGSPHFHADSARLAHDRTMNFLVPRVGPSYDLEALWEAHLDYEFTTRDVDLTMSTMVDQPYVNHIPTMTGGVGYADLRRFYKDYFINANPEDTGQITVSRTQGVRQIVDEVIFSFTHDRRIEWLLPGVAPTGRRLRFGLVGVVRFKGDKLCHEHIYWDQACVLVQAGLLDRAGLPVVGAEGADKITDNGIPSNRLIAGW
ncbi:dienelactone hydrolase family protein [Delftia acidovorans]|uniref:Dienelactone hydrolase family protein n=1 Tax=Delftia acidovorans TaxID=80866 RepID=A0A7T2S7I0_DELAC|nr:dienelactone hydrolase family protein [Delftia acidovorans]QPS10353.1 dienelactone hydrolase family protein [Delftia acidovorans]